MAAALKYRALDIADQAEAHFDNPETAGKLFVPSSFQGLALANPISYRYASVDHAFPPIDPGCRPLGNMVLVQVRCALEKSGNIILPTDSRQTEQYNTQIAKVISMGPLAFHNRNTGELWPEGAWCGVGDFVRIPKYQGERFMLHFKRPEMKFEDGKWHETKQIVTDEVEFVFLQDLRLTAVYTADPLTIRAFY